MSEHRFVITDRLWQRIAPLLPGKATDRGVTAGDNRLFLEAVLWHHCPGSPEAAGAKGALSDSPLAAPAAG